VNSTDFPMADAMLNWRVAIVASCIEDARLRPTDPKYLLPENLREHPYWDCSTFPTYWSFKNTSVEGAAMDMQYGGAAVYRLAMPRSAVISVAADADPRVRTKVLAAGDGKLHKAEVRELRPGESARFGGRSREIFVVQVNVDPKGEMITGSDVDPLWGVTTFACPQGCWMLGGTSPGQEYPPNSVEGLRSPLLRIPIGAVLKFNAMWNLEPEFVDGGSVVPGCPAKGYDGVQVRVHTYEGDEESIAVLQPHQGYGAGPGGETALYAFLTEGVYDSSAPCANFDGWTGTSSVFQPYTVPLGGFAGKTVRFEFLFASDVALGGLGFWVRNIEVIAPNNGGVVYAENIDDPTMTPFTYINAPPTAGHIRPFTGVPVVAGYPTGYAPDLAFLKRFVTRRAPWSAHWCNKLEVKDPAPRLQRAYLGWSYSADLFVRAMLHPGQEACVEVAAPFAGSVQSASLYSLRTKISVTSLTLTMRSPKPPFKALGAPWHSGSREIMDSITHRFILGKRAPVQRKGAAFLFCVAVQAKLGIGGFEPYLELPLTELGAAGNKEGPGRTFLFEPKTGVTSGSDPWNGYTLALRAEFVQCRHRWCWFGQERETIVKAEVERPASKQSDAKVLVQGPFTFAAAIAVVAGGSLLAVVLGRMLSMRQRARRLRSDAQELMTIEEDEEENFHE